MVHRCPRPSADRLQRSMSRGQRRKPTRSTTLSCRVGGSNHPAREASLRHVARRTDLPLTGRHPGEPRSAPALAPDARVTNERARPTQNTRPGRRRSTPAVVPTRPSRSSRRKHGPDPGCRQRRPDPRRVAPLQSFLTPDEPSRNQHRHVTQYRPARCRTEPRPLPGRTVAHERPPPAWDTKPEAHQGDVPTPRTDTQNVFLCRATGMAASSRSAEHDRLERATRAPHRRSKELEKSRDLRRRRPLAIELDDPATRIEGWK